MTNHSHLALGGKMLIIVDLKPSRIQRDRHIGTIAGSRPSGVSAPSSGARNIRLSTPLQAWPGANLVQTRISIHTVTRRWGLAPSLAQMDAIVAFATAASILVRSIPGRRMIRRDWQGSSLRFWGWVRAGQNHSPQAPHPPQQVNWRDLSISVAIACGGGTFAGQHFQRTLPCSRRD